MTSFITQKNTTEADVGMESVGKDADITVDNRKNASADKLSVAEANNVEDTVKETDVDVILSRDQKVNVIETHKEASVINIVENHFGSEIMVPKPMGDTVYQRTSEESVGNQERLEAVAPPIKHMRQPQERVADIEAQRPVVKEEFKPLTLEQLKSLYYNVMLDNNTAYIDKFIQVRLLKSYILSWFVIYTILRADYVSP